MSKAITTLEEAKKALDQLAMDVGSATRLTRTEKMAMLEKIYAIKLSTEDRDRLMQYVIDQRKLEGANRAFLLRTNNPFVLPLRYVFPGIKDGSNVSRYAGALCELSSLKVPTEKFHESIKANGGITELYWKNRQRVTKKQIRAKLTLNRTIEVVSGTEITLRLMPNANGVFEVLSMS